MSIAPGTRLGPYEVTALIGQGGMGEVYRAHDTKLGRDVALKVLPDLFADDPERLARFQREARVLASLNHPNIASIYGLEESEGIRALVLELVEGPTLAERIAEGAIPVDEALPIAKQIAEALEAAHERGVIHRDLKPANVKVKADGMVKVLDFGLAKALDPSPEGDPSESPTLTAAATQMGVIMGTAAYMSPEQVSGKGVDKRSDIWSFGVVLFEALTGQAPFRGETVSHVFASVLKTEADWTLLPAEAPPALQRLVRRCLQKDRKQRLRDIGEGWVALQEAAAESAGPLTASLPSVVRASAGWRRALPWSVAALMTCVAGLALWNGRSLSEWPGLIRARPAALSTKRFAIQVASTHSLFTGREGGTLDLSPDGSKLVYVGMEDDDGRLYVRSLDQLDASPIPGTERARAPFFSPDGEWVGFFSENALKKVSLAGGRPVTLCAVPGTRAEGNWSSVDTIVFAYRGSPGILEVSATGGTPQAITAPDRSGGVRHRAPELLPGGDALLFTVDLAGPNTPHIAVQPRTGDQRILAEGAHATYVSTGHVIFWRQSSLWALPFDLARLDATGDPVPVLDGVEADRPGGEQFAVANDGTLVYLSSSAPAEIVLVWVDRGGRATPLAVPPGRYREPRLSPDGQRVAVTLVESPGRESDIWEYDLERGTLARLTVEGNMASPVWTPDGTRVTFQSLPPGIPGLFWKQAGRSGEAEPLLTGERDRVPSSWSPDGEALAFSGSVRRFPLVGARGAPGPRPSDIWIMPLGGEPTPFLATPASERAAMFSPDGRWLAYVSDESGRDEIYVAPYPGPGRRELISLAGGSEPQWSSESGELFYRNSDQLMVVTVTAEPEFTATRPEPLFDARYMPNPRGEPNYDVTPDGQRFLMIRREDPGATQAYVVLNWFEELKRLVPVD